MVRPLSYSSPRAPAHRLPPARAADGMPPLVDNPLPPLTFIYASDLPPPLVCAPPAFALAPYPAPILFDPASEPDPDPDLDPAPSFDWSSPCAPAFAPEMEAEAEGGEGER